MELIKNKLLQKVIFFILTTFSTFGAFILFEKQHFIASEFSDVNKYIFMSMIISAFVFFPVQKLIKNKSDDKHSSNQY